MSELDLIVRGGRVVTGGHVTIADIGVAEGVITALGPNLAAVADHEVDATGMHAFPGGVDSHVHFNDPGLTEWETIAAGSAALAAGGYTCFVDMPLNNLPVTTTAKAFDLKLDAAQRTSILDFGLWGGLVPGNLGHLEELAARGVIGFKAFMCPSGIDEFPACDETVLREGMKRIGDLDSILLVHAEDPAALHPPGGTGWRDYVKSRPPDAEWMAIYQAIALAAETGCRLHIVHVSTKHGIELVDEAHRHGIDVSAETCPHYLLYSSGDLDRLGGVGKCSPPFRTNDDRDGLWRQLADGVLPPATAQRHVGGGVGDGGLALRLQRQAGDDGERRRGHVGRPHHVVHHRRGRGRRHAEVSRERAGTAELRHEHVGRRGQVEEHGPRRTGGSGPQRRAAPRPGRPLRRSSISRPGSATSSTTSTPMPRCGPSAIDGQPAYLGRGSCRRRERAARFATLTAVPLGL